MKRLLIFGSIFGFGLLVLVLVLGPSRLVRQSEDPEIGGSDLTDVRGAVEMKESSAEGRTISFAMEGAGRIPIWKEQQLPDGSLQRLKAALLAYRGIEPFVGGFHFEQPSLDFFPGLGVDESRSASIVAGGCDLALRGETSGATQFSQGLRPADIRAFTFSPAVVIQQFDAAGNVTMRFETERLEAPEVPLVDVEAALFLEKLVAPGALRFRQGDGAFDLRAGGLELDRASGRLTLQPPLVLEATSLALPGMNGASPASPPATAPAASRAPMTLTSDGPATFVSAPAATPDGAARNAAKPATVDAAAAFDVANVIGPGELVFTKNVLLKQEERWLRTERLALTIVRDAAGALIVSHVDAGRPQTPIALGVMGGEGEATRLDWNASDEQLTLAGPVALHDLVLGEGAAARKLELSARERVTIRQLPALGQLPARVEVILEQAAHVAIAGELAADGDRVVAVLLPPNKQPGQERALRLLSVEVTGALAVANLTGRGHAQARTLRLGESDDGTRTVHLDGDARADFDRGFVVGPTLDLTIPPDPKQPTTVLVPQLLAAELALPAGAALFEPRLVGAAQPTALVVAKNDTPSPPLVRRLVIEPAGPCSFTQIGEAVDLIGRACYRVRAGVDAGAADLQTLHADELHLQPEGDGQYRARALGDVTLKDATRGLDLHAATARTETQRRGDRDARLLLLDGAPARIERSEAGKVDAPLVVESPSFEFDLDTEALLAVDPAGHVRVEAPEALLADLFPSHALPDPPPDAVPAAIAAAAPPLVLTAERVEFTPGAGAKPFESGALLLHGAVVVERPLDGSTVTCEQLAFDLAAGTATVDGREGVPVVLRRPKPYDATRVESLTAAWLRIDRPKQRITAAPGSIFVLHPEEPPSASRPLPPLRRVELRATDAPELLRRRLSFDGGVELDFTFGELTAHARAERAELLLARGLDEGPFEPLRLNLTQRVRLDYGAYHATGNLLSYRVHSDPGERAGPGSIELKEGVERGALLGQDDGGRWQVTAWFKLMLIHPPTSEDPEERIEFDALELGVEALRGE